MSDKIAIDNIDRDPTNRNGGKIPELATSIKKVGLLHPIVLKKGEKGRFRLIAGHRRLAACIMLGWTHVDAKIVGEEDSLLLRIAENVSRQDLAPYEMATEVNGLVQAGYKIAEIAHVTGYSASAIASYGRLVPSLCKEAWELFVSQGRKAKVSEWFPLCSLTPENQRAQLFGDRVSPRVKRSRVTRPMVAAKLRQLAPGDSREKTLRWFLGEIPWKETGE